MAKQTPKKPAKKVSPAQRTKTTLDSIYSRAPKPKSEVLKEKVLSTYTDKVLPYAPKKSKKKK